jgi:hypothetical protein
MPDTIDIHINNLKIKLQLLLKKHTAVVKENEQILIENDSYKSKIKELTEKSDLLTQQVNILKASAGKLEGKEKNDFEKSINRYLTSIDKCILMLNK